MDGGDLDYVSDYKGVYFLTEKIKRSDDRTDISKLEPSDNMEPEITGGYLLRQEFGASVASKRLPGSSHTELVEPDPVDEATAAQKQWIADHINDFDQALNGANFKDSELGYAPYLDLPSYANLLVINELTRDQDGYIRSHYFHKDRGGPIVQGPVWDYNLIWGTGCCRNNRNAIPAGGDSGWQFMENNGANEWRWEVRLVQDEDFWQAFGDRWQVLRDGLLEDAAFQSRINEHVAGLEDAAERNFAAWPGLLANASPGFPSPVTADWEGQVDYIKQWTSDRMLWIDSQFVAKPTLVDGGVVAPGAEVTVGGAVGSIYYTTDGTDPRLPGGGVNPSAIEYHGSNNVSEELLASNSSWSYLDDGSDQGGSSLVAGAPGFGSTNWKHPNYDDSGWGSGPAPLGYSNPVQTVVSYGPNAGSKHITTYLRRDFEVVDADQFVGLEMEVQRDDGVIVYLNGKEVARSNMPGGVVLFSTGASSPQGSGDETAWNQFQLDPSDLVEGTNVFAVELHQSSGASSDLSFDLSLNGSKPSSTGGAPVVTVDSTTTVIARNLNGGAWSGPVEETYVIGGVASAANLVVSEIHYHPKEPSLAEQGQGFLDQDDFEFLELRNVSEESLDMTGVSFEEGVTFEFSPGFRIGPGETVIVARNEAALLYRYPSLQQSLIAGEFEGGTGLSNGGEQLRLVAMDGSTIQDFTYDDKFPWPEGSDGSGVSLVLIYPFDLPDHGDPYSWRESSSEDGNPTGSDSTTFPGGEADALLAYATGGLQQGTVSVTSDGKIRYYAGQNLRAEDVQWRVELSDDLSDWVSADEYLQRLSVTPKAVDAWEVLYEVTVPADTSRWFIRSVIDLR